MSPIQCNKCKECGREFNKKRSAPLSPSKRHRKHPHDIWRQMKEKVMCIQPTNIMMVTKCYVCMLLLTILCSYSFSTFMLFYTSRHSILNTMATMYSFLSTKGMKKGGHGIHMVPTVQVTASWKAIPMWLSCGKHIFKAMEEVCSYICTFL